MIYRIVLFVFSCIVFICSCATDSGPDTSFNTLEQKQLPLPSHQKKVAVLLIDSLTSTLLDQAIKEGNVPALSFLHDHGQIVEQLITPFPSMSVVIESSLLTGTSPSEHRVPGLIWYDQEENRLVDYGSTVSRTWKLGTKQVVLDGIDHLNNQHLSHSTETVIERLQTLGYSTASINMLVYRGFEEQILTLPFSVQHGLHMQDQVTTYGPDLLAFGALAKPKQVAKRNLPDSIINRFGLNDHYTAEVVKSLLTGKEIPDFLMAFFPDFDTATHKHGNGYIDGLATVDTYLQDILNQYDSWEQALEKQIFIVMGDHGQDQLLSAKEDVIIDIESLLAPLTVSPLVEHLEDGQVIVANNHRMAYLYPVSAAFHAEKLAQQLLADLRVDHVAWLEDNTITVRKAGMNDQLQFHAGGVWEDRYGQTWSFSGEPAILDIQVDDDNHFIQYDEYPDAFNQLTSALNSHSSAFLLTAKPGHVLKTEGSPVHTGGGEHGGFHANDVNTMMMISGTSKSPASNRMIDLKNYFLTLFE